MSEGIDPSEFSPQLDETDVVEETPVAQSPPAPAKRKPGRPAKAEKEKTDAQLAAQTPDDVPRDPVNLWTALYAQWVKEGRSPDDIRLRIERVEMSGRPVAPTTMPPEMLGSQMAGDAALNRSPGEQLSEHIMNYCHVNSPPAAYRVVFLNRHTGRKLRVSEKLLLESSFDIQRRTDAMNRQEEARQLGGFFPGARPFYQPQMQPPPQAPALGGDITGKLLDIVMRNAAQPSNIVEEIRRVVAESQPAPVAPQQSDFDKFLDTMKRMREAGLLPNQQQPSLTEATLVDAVTKVVVKLQEAGVIPKNAPVAAAPAGPPPDSIESLIANKEKENRLKARLSTAFGLVDAQEAEAARTAEEKPKAIESQEFPLSRYNGEALRWLPFPGSEAAGEMDWKTWLTRMALENPRRSSDFFSSVLEKLGRILPKEALGNLIGAMQQQGGDAAAAAATHANGAAWTPSA